MSEETTAALVEQVRLRYGEAARAVLNPHGDPGCGCGPNCCGTAEDAAAAASGTPGCCATSSCCGGTHATGSAALDTADCFGGSLYREGETDGLPAEAVLASLGCGNPLAVADLKEGERVLDLGSGGGIDVLLSARRVGPSGFAYGVDMTDDMLALARLNAAKAGARNVKFLQGQIEDLPLAAASVDVVISNCVINLSGDKPRVLREVARVLRPGGRFAVSDVIADPDMDDATRADMAAWTGCIAGALTREQFTEALTAAGLAGVEIRESHRVHEHAASAIVRATKPLVA
jgi:arsenite methyltransferase